MAIENQSIKELEARIMINNVILKWLRSGDPMLSDPKYSPLVPSAIRHHEEMGRQLMEVCRAKKIQRDGDPNQNPTKIMLKPGKLTPQAGMR